MVPSFLHSKRSLKTSRSAAVPARRVGRKFENRFAIPFAIANFDGIDEASARFGIDGQAIDHDPDWLREIDVEQSFGRRKLVQAAVLVEAVEAALLNVDQARCAPILARAPAAFSSATG